MSRCIDGCINGTTFPLELRSPLATSTSPGRKKCANGTWVIQFYSPEPRNVLELQHSVSENQ